MHTQVKGYYTWSITFTSNQHDGTDSYEEWTGLHQGFSKSWGLNVGNIPQVSCVTTGAPLLVATNPLGLAHCDVCHGDTTCTDGSLPLDEEWTITYDTSGCAPDVCAVQASHTTAALRHNAKATRAEALALATHVLSVEEALEALPNVGDVEVSRTGPDLADGGYTWTITFLRDTSETNTRCVETIGLPRGGQRAGPGSRHHCHHW